MRGFDCHYYKMMKTGKLIKNFNQSCWAAILRNESYCIYIDGNRTVPALNEELKDYIFIAQFEEPEVAKESMERIIQLINRITECSIVEIENVKYIKYKLLTTYSQNLLLLNIIRMLWHEPRAIDLKNFLNESIFKKATNKDPLSFLLECMNENIDQTLQYHYYGDHSCVYKDIQLRTKDELLAYKGGTMQLFLMQKK